MQTRAHRHAEQGSWVQPKVLGVGRGPGGAEQGSQQGAGILAVDQGSHKCSCESWGCRAGSWGTAKGLRGAEPGSWGATRAARGAAGVSGVQHQASAGVL